MTLRILPLFLALTACGPVDISDGSDVDSAIDCDPCEGDADTDSDSDADADADADSDADEWTGYVQASGFVISFSDDGFSDDVYLADAYMVGYGGELGYNLNHRSTNSGGRFAFDTSGWSNDCYDSSLISSLKIVSSEGGVYTYGEISSWDQTSDWWDNHDFCTSGSPAAEDWCVHEGGSNYFIGFCVTDAGVVPNGDGY